MWIQTYTGKCIDFNNIENVEICIEDIAHALSLQCRFNGHCKKFYSIAEHSIYVAERTDQNWFEGYGYKAPLRLIWFALLHDAAEAYIGDMVAPLKHSNKLDFFIEMENKLKARIGEIIIGDSSFLFCPSSQKLIKRADLELLATERDQLMVKLPKEWDPLPDPINIKLKCYSPNDAKLFFFQKVLELGLFNTQ